MVALPIHHELPGEKYLRLYQRGLALWSSHVAGEAGFGAAAAYARGDMASIAEANCVLGEVAQGDEAGIMEYFAKAGTAPLAWYLANEDCTLIAGLRAGTAEVMRLESMPANLPQTHDDLTILPARAAFGQLEELAPVMRSDCAAKEAIEAEVSHLDDSRVDAIIALRAGRAVGYASVLSVGDAGLITNVFVRPDCRGRGYGKALGGRILDVCTRSLFKDVLLAVGDGKSGFAERLGFVEGTRVRVARQ